MMLLRLILANQVLRLATLTVKMPSLKYVTRAFAQRAARLVVKANQ